MAGRNLTNTDIVYRYDVKPIRGLDLELTPWPEDGSHNGWSSTGACFTEVRNFTPAERVTFLAMIAYDLATDYGFTAAQIDAVFEPLKEWKVATKIWNRIYRPIG